MTSAPGHPGRDGAPAERDPAEPDPDGLGEAIRTGRVPVVPGSLVDLVMQSGSGNDPGSDSPGSDASGSAASGSAVESGGSGAPAERDVGPAPSATGSTGTGFAALVRGGASRPAPATGEPSPAGAGTRPTPEPRTTPASPRSDEGRAGSPDPAGVDHGDDSYADLGDLGDDPLGLGPLPAEDSDDPLHTPADRFAPAPSFAPEPTGEATATPAAGRPRTGGDRTGADDVPVTEPAPTVVPPISPTPRPLDDAADVTPATAGTGPVPSTPDTVPESDRAGSGDPASSKRWPPPRPSRPADDPETDILPPGAMIGHYPSATAGPSGPAGPRSQPDAPAAAARPTMADRPRPAPSEPDRHPAPRRPEGGSPTGPATTGLSGNDLFATPSGTGTGRGFGELPGRGADARAPAPTPTPPQTPLMDRKPRATGPKGHESAWAPPEPGAPGAPESGPQRGRPRPPLARPGQEPTAAEPTVTMSAVGEDGRPRTGRSAVEGTPPVTGRPDAAPDDRAPGASPQADPAARNAAAAASVGAVSVAAARTSSGRDGAVSDTGPGTTVQPRTTDATGTTDTTEAGPKPITPRREALMSAKPRNGRRGVSPAGLAIALAILLLGALTLWAMLSPVPQDDGANRPAASDSGPGFGPRPAAAPAGTSLAEPTVRATVPAGSSAVAVTASPGGTALAAVRDENRLLVLDGATDAVTAEVPLPATPQGVTTSPDGTRAFVSMSGDTSGQVAVIDVPGATVLDTVPVTGDPAGAVASADGRFLYLPSRAEGVVDELDPYAGVVTRSVPVSRDPYAAAANDAADRVYLATRGADQLTVLDPNSLTVLGSFPVAGGAEAVAVAPDSVPEPQVAVAGPDSDTVTVLNPSDGREIATVEASGGPTALAFAADGRHLYVTTEDGLQVIDTGTWQVTGTTDVAGDPTAVSVSPDGSTGWVTGDGEVSVLNLT